MAKFNFSKVILAGLGLLLNLSAVSLGTDEWLNGQHQITNAEVSAWPDANIHTVPAEGIILEVMSAADNSSAKTPVEETSGEETPGRRLAELEKRIADLEAALAAAQQRYLDALDRIYAGLAGDDSRLAFLLECLASQQDDVKLWSLNKVDAWRNSGTDVPVEALGEPLKSLVCDRNGQIRLATSRLLALLVKIDSSQKLIEQFRCESDPAVRIELLAAIGQVGGYASSAGSSYNISPEIRIEALDAASVYLDSNEPEKSLIGAEVIRKLLLKDGLDEKLGRAYFELLAKRYQRQDNTVEYRAKLLDEMSRLCGNDSYYRAVATELFDDIFVSALGEVHKTLVEAAAVGLINIDPVSGYKLLVERGFWDTKSEIIQRNLVDLAASYGEASDMEWLNHLRMNAASMEIRKNAAGGMLKVFQKCPAPVLMSWAKRLSAEGTEQDLVLVRNALELAEKKTSESPSSDLKKQITIELAVAYKQSKDYEQAARYLGSLVEQADANEKKLYAADLLDVYLHGGKFGAAADMLTAQLAGGDIDEATSSVIDAYFNTVQDAGRISAAAAKLQSVKYPPKRPIWEKRLADWTQTAAAIVSDANLPVDVNGRD